MHRKLLPSSPKLNSGLLIKPRYVSALEGLLRAKTRKGRLKLTLVTQLSMHVLLFAVENGMAVAVHQWLGLWHTPHSAGLLCDTEKTTLHLRGTEIRVFPTKA